MGRTSFDKVAENIITCFACGVSLKMDCTSLLISKLSMVGRANTYLLPAAFCRTHLRWSVSICQIWGLLFCKVQEFFLGCRPRCVEGCSLAFWYAVESAVHQRSLQFSVLSSILQILQIHSWFSMQALCCDKVPMQKLDLVVVPTIESQLERKPQSCPFQIWLDIKYHCQLSLLGYTLVTLSGRAKASNY